MLREQLVLTCVALCHWHVELVW